MLAYQSSESWIVFRFQIIMYACKYSTCLRSVGVVDKNYRISKKKKKKKKKKKGCIDACCCY